MEANPNTASINKAKRGQEIIRKWGEMCSVVAPWKTVWQEIAELSMPRKAGISSITHTPDVNKESRIFDTTANDALMTMAGGLMTWTTPANEPWFNFQPTFRLRKFDAVKQWLQDCSSRTLELLANSTFYTERHEDLLNHCSFGLSAMYCAFEAGRLRFESLPVGTFCVEENAYGECDTLYREMHLTARQAAELFGTDNLPKHIKDALDQEKPTATFCFIHAVYPRPESERPKGVARRADWGKPFASCYVDAKEKVVVKESGYDSFPFSVGRYLKWSALGAKTPYGYGPGFASLPDVRQTNFLQMVLGVAAEKSVRPAMIAPEELERSINLSAGGITYVPMNMVESRWPKPIQQTGDYTLGMEHIKMLQESIKAKYHFPLFNMLANVERQMTAYEVAARESEKITLISPAFSRLVAEKDTPMLRRLFELCAMANVFDPPPPEAIEQMSEFMLTVPPPDVTYTSRLALAIQQLQNLGFDRQFAGDMAIAQIDPSVMDNYNLDVLTRDRARNNGVPPSWLRDEREVAAIRQQRAQAQQAANSMAMVEQGSKAAKNLGGIDKVAEAIGM